VGFFLLRQGFRPLDRILSRVREIGSKNLATRIPGESGPPELQELADTLNTMLQRLDTAFRAREVFIAGVSHDLRTPLTVLQGQIDIMLMQPSVDQETRQSLQSMAAEARRLTRMTNNLLLSAQLESSPTFALEEIDLGELLHDVVRETQVLAKDLNLKVSIPDIVAVSGDHDLLKQMVLNVIDNALKFTLKGGSVELSLSGDEEWAVVTVSDTGEGIPQEHLAHIAEPFYKVHTTRGSDRGGAGLGLAIIKQIITLHGGQLDIQSRVGMGTTVIMKLPLRHT
jgi:two-component system OmpR family sensor kinase